MRAVVRLSAVPHTNAFWLGSLTHWLTNEWEISECRAWCLSNLHMNFLEVLHIYEKSEANVTWITNDFQSIWMCIAWFDRKSTDKRAQTTTKQREYVLVKPNRAYAQWKLPLKFPNIFEWMVKIRSYTCFVNRKHLNGRFRLVIPGVNSIDCVAFYDLIKITLKSIFQWNVTKFTLYKRINRRKGVQ